MQEHPHSTSLGGWVQSRTGIVTLGFIAATAFLIATGHAAHLLGALPYLLLLACPAMHFFMHGHHGQGHEHHHGEDRRPPEEQR